MEHACTRLLHVGGITINHMGAHFVVNNDAHVLLVKSVGRSQKSMPITKARICLPKTWVFDGYKYDLHVGEYTDVTLTRQDVHLLEVLSLWPVT